MLLDVLVELNKFLVFDLPLLSGSEHKMRQVACSQWSYSHQKACLLSQLIIARHNKSRPPDSDAFFSVNTPSHFCVESSYRLWITQESKILYFVNFLGKKVSPVVQSTIPVHWSSPLIVYSLCDNLCLHHVLQCLPHVLHTFLPRVQISTFSMKTLRVLHFSSSFLFSLVSLDARSEYALHGSSTCRLLM